MKVCEGGTFFNKGTRKRYLYCEDGIQKDKNLDLRAETWWSTLTREKGTRTGHTKHGKSWNSIISFFRPGVGHGKS